jgi:kynurenine 3-monooxygenase
VQRQLLIEATCGHQSLDTIDWTALDQRVLAQLPILQDAP